jgi:hypothetical protein
MAQAPHKTLGKNMENKICAHYQRRAANQIQRSSIGIQYLEHSLEQSDAHTETCLLGDKEWRTLHVLERLLATTTPLTIIEYLIPLHQQMQSGDSLHIKDLWKENDQASSLVQLED